MAREYKTYTGSHFLRLSKTGGGRRQTSVMVCTQTKKKAVELLNQGSYFTVNDLNGWFSIHTNGKYHEIGLANKDKLMYSAISFGDREYTEYVK